MLKLHIYLFIHKKLKLKCHKKHYKVYNSHLTYIGIFQSKPLQCPHKSTTLYYFERTYIKICYSELKNIKNTDSDIMLI